MALTPVPEEGNQNISDRERAVRAAAGRAMRTSWTSVAVGEPTPNPLDALHRHYAPLAYQLPWELLEYVELLAGFNPDFSQAADNIRTLANSGHNLFVDGPVRTVDRVKSLLEEKARSIQEQHGGIDGLIDKLLLQASTFGAMCGEWVVNEELTEVIDFIDVNPKSIRFFWEEEHWAPYQKVTHAQAKEAEKRGQTVRQGNCIKLNEVTFHYFAFNAAPSSPYGVPPFLSALANIAIQKDMTHNMSQIVKKAGLLAIVDMTVKQLPRMPGETDSDFEARAGAYLDEYVNIIEDMVREGGLVHFDDVEVSTSSLASNMAGATAIFKQNEELVFSGLKSMPSVQGRSYSTTETYAGVAYDIIIRNTYKYQKAAKRMIESGYWLIASLAGEQPEKIQIVFNGNKTLQRLQDAQAETLEIRNAAMLWLAKLIDHTGFAQRLGFTHPEEELDAPPLELIGAAKKDTAQSGGSQDSSADSTSQS